MDEDILFQVRQIIEEKACKGLERFNNLCRLCQQECESKDCRITYARIRKMWDWEDGKEGRDIVKIKSGGCTEINEMRPLLSIFDPPGPLSIREKIFDFFDIENGKMGVMVLKEMAKRNEKFKIFLIKICLFARDESMYEYAEDQALYDELIK